MAQVSPRASWGSWGACQPGLLFPMAPVTSRRFVAQAPAGAFLAAWRAGRAGCFFLIWQLSRTAVLWPDSGQNGAFGASGAPARSLCFFHLAAMKDNRCVAQVSPRAFWASLDLMHCLYRSNASIRLANFSLLRSPLLPVSLVTPPSGILEDGENFLRAASEQLSNNFRRA